MTLARWGTFGTPVLVFPTAGGDAEEIERFHLVDACGDLIDAGRVKLYSVDSVNGRVLLAGEGDSRHQAWIQRQFFEFLRHEVRAGDPHATAPPTTSRSIIAGSSIGAFNALGCVCLHPDVFRAAICMSGTYDLRRFYDGPGRRRLLRVVAAPLRAGARRPGARPAAPALRAAGQRRGRQRGHRRVVDGGPRARRDGRSRTASTRGAREWQHDWPLWRAMLPQYLEELV